jgi:UDP-N-acetylmuramoyl-L-alanyl-D-glutamate--2,6-diaminopimelate ligase
VSNYALAHLLTCLADFDITVAATDLPLEPQQRLGKLTNDSRAITENDVFCAVIGSQQDGRKYNESAANNGVALIISECIHVQQHGKVTFLTVNRQQQQICVPIVHFYQLNQKLFKLAQHFYQQPQQQLTMIGVTGTNGKTSTCLLIAKLLTELAQKSAVIGTLGAGLVPASTDEQAMVLQPLENTTPGATKLHQLLAEFAEQQVQNVAMEVSSHALVQQRLSGQLINIAVFTNLTRDHLDFHHTMSAYSAAKRLLFTGSAEQVAILNGDQELTLEWLENWPTQQPTIIYGQSASIASYPKFVQAVAIVHHSAGVDFTLVSHVGEIRITSPLFGDFNIDNLLAAIAVVLAKNIHSAWSLTDLASAVTQLTPIIGRMEQFTGLGRATAVVDYAHTPDALFNAIQACREHCAGKLWLVFGCGGDRDPGKRAEMGKIAEQGADHVVITNDNPRHEAAELIAQAILSGCQQPEKITVMLDRKQAVLSTLAKAKTEDIVLLAGKGHEQYLIIGDNKLPYNERAVVAQFYNQEAMP